MATRVKKIIDEKIVCQVYGTSEGIQIFSDSKDFCFLLALKKNVGCDFLDGEEVSLVIKSRRNEKH